MLNARAFLSSSESSETTAILNDGLQQKLNLYQVFLRLYEQNRGLLDEILELGSPSMGSGFAQTSSVQYIHGIVLKDRVGVMTNVMKGATQTIFQAHNIWTIGRDRSKSVIAVVDDRLSRCHAAVVFSHKKQAFYLVDFDSTNGSFINGEQIRKNQRLKDGDRVRLGSLSFTFFTCASVRHVDQMSEEYVNYVSRLLNENPNSEPQEMTATSEQNRYLSVDSGTPKEPLSDDVQMEAALDDTSMFLRP